ncbi:MAG: hypothetical protein ABIS86_12835 [Streptosporangiaceae bacterium]
MADATRAGPDPLAVALGNASLLGVGYLMLGRRLLAFCAGVVTILLVSVLVSVARSWCEFVVFLWWVAVIAHGWFLAGGRDHRVTVGGQRLVAFGALVPVVLVVGLLRFDAARIERSVTEARESGDCARLVTAQRRVWLGHRIADAPMTARGDEPVRACGRLQTAKARLTTGLTGDTGELKAGFDILAAVLAAPGNDRTVEVVLNGFLSSVPAQEPCQIAAITDWLRQRPSPGPPDRSADTVTRTAPAALVGCGDHLMSTNAWQTARTRYQQLLDQYPGDEHAVAARNGVKQATLTIELENVRGLLEGSTDTRPAYCSTPAKYSGAAPYGKGTNRALFYGNGKYTGKLPAEWRTTDVTHAVLVVCAGEQDYGSSVQSCHYENKLLPRFPRKVTFHKIAIPVKVYELRTGRLVADRKVAIGGKSCPRVLRYTTSSFLTDIGPRPDAYVVPSQNDVRAGFRSLINR